MLNKNITILDEKRKTHSKASEEYISVKFEYPDLGKSYEIWVPVEYRRTGVSIKTTEELNEFLNKVYVDMNPKNYEKWLKTQEDFWTKEKPGAGVTKSFFDELKKGGWKCVECQLPSNPNWARRIQDLKEFGYTISTDTKKYCQRCGANKTHLMLLPISRGLNLGTGYETWTPKLRKRILSVLGNFDVYENRANKHLLPDHKFSEIRWDENTKEDNPDTMSDEEIRSKFQLISNQRNQQKREVCRTCYQTKKRGVIFGIPFFYEGGPDWPEDIPEKGKDAEQGCVGCGWYDIDKWRNELVRVLTELNNKGESI